MKKLSHLCCLAFGYSTSLVSKSLSKLWEEIKNFPVKPHLEQAFLFRP